MLIMQQPKVLMVVVQDFIYLWSPASINGAPTNYGGYKYFSSRSSNMAYDSSGLGNTSVFVSGFFNTQSAM